MPTPQLDPHVAHDAIPIVPGEHGRRRGEPSVRRTWLLLDAAPAISVIFLVPYARIACPYVCSLAEASLFRNLLIVCGAHILLRLLLRYNFPRPPADVSPARHGYRLAVISWFAAGVLAMGLHAALYPEFPFGSHLKLMSGYFALGAGIIAQWEYVVLERLYRADTRRRLVPRKRWERIPRRLMEGTVIFTIAPSFAMILVVLRLISEGGLPRRAVFEVGGLGLVFVALSLLVAWRYGRTLQEDADEILAGVGQIGRGRFEVALDDTRPDELGEIAGGINGMAQGLILRERIREAFGRFVNPAVAEDFIERYARTGQAAVLGGKRRQLAFLFSDLRDFTSLSETLGPEDLVLLLNDYLGRMVKAIQDHGGVVDKFVGDAVFAVFGLGERPNDCAEDAVRAAVEMQGRLAAMNEERALAPRRGVRGAEPSEDEDRRKGWESEGFTPFERSARKPKPILAARSAAGGSGGGAPRRRRPAKRVGIGKIHTL